MSHMNKLLCLFHLHFYGGWHAITEIPIWKRGSFGDGLCLVVGNQPVREQLYSTSGGGTLKKFEPDTQFHLVGKVIEQRRTCIRPGCHYIQVQLRKWKV
jgi:hypothetical protein